MSEKPPLPSIPETETTVSDGQRDDSGMVFDDIAGAWEELAIGLIISALENRVRTKISAHDETMRIAGTGDGAASGGRFTAADATLHPEPRNATEMTAAGFGSVISAPSGWEARTSAGPKEEATSDDKKSTSSSLCGISATTVQQTIVEATLDMMNEDWLYCVGVVLRGQATPPEEQVEIRLVMPDVCWKIINPVMPEPYCFIDASTYSMISLLKIKELRGWCDRWLSGHSPWPDQVKAENPGKLLTVAP